MKKIICISLMSWMTVGSAWAVTSNLGEKEAATRMELAKSSGCLSCHAVEEKIVGPAYLKVAAKYKDTPDAVASLVQSVRYGSSGKWGRLAMPAHDTMNEADIKKIVQWVLSLQP